MSKDFYKKFPVGCRVKFSQDGRSGVGVLTEFCYKWDFGHVGILVESSTAKIDTSPLHSLNGKLKTNNGWWVQMKNLTLLEAPDDLKMEEML